MERYECVEGQIVYISDSGPDGCRTNYESYIHRIYRLIKDGSLCGFISLTQLEMEGLETFGLFSATSQAYPMLMEDAKNDMANFNQ